MRFLTIFIAAETRAQVLLKKNLLKWSSLCSSQLNLYFFTHYVGHCYLSKPTHVLFMLLASVKNVINLICMLLTRTFKIFIDGLLHHPCYQNSIHYSLTFQGLVHLLYLLRRKTLIRGRMVPGFLGSKNIRQKNGCPSWNRFGMTSNSEGISEEPSPAVTWHAQVVALLLLGWSQCSAGRRTASGSVSS